MSSAVVSTSAAQGRPFVFDDEAEAEASCGDSRPRLSGRAQLDWRSPTSKILPSAVTPASRIEIRPAPEMVPSGISAIDALTGGLPRGCLTEICGPASSGRTTFLLAALAAATRRGEFCTLVDASDALDPHSAAAAGVALDRLLWVRCGEDSPQKGSQQKSRAKQTGCPISRASFAREACPELVERVGISQTAFKFAPNESQKSERRLEQVLRATDLLLESGGFGLIVLDLADLPPHAARRIPLTTWFRFRRAIEHTSTILLAIEQHPIAGSCSSLLLQLGAQNNPEEMMKLAQSNSSREAAAWESPARQCRVGTEKENKSRRDGTELAARDNATHDAQDAPQIAHHPTHAHLLTGMDINAELIRSRLDRKPAHSVRFETKTAWAG
jgi:recombination protein RecA